MLEDIMAEFNIEKNKLNQGGKISIVRKRGNNYTIEGDSVKVELRRRDGNNLYTYIDLDDLQRIIIDHPYTWFAGWNPHNKSFYARCTPYSRTINESNLQWNMNSVIMNPEHDPNIVVDHIDHDTLNNRKSNLRRASSEHNSKHRSGANSNNKSGYRNVCLLGKWYQVQLMIDGKNSILGKFRYVEDAAKFAKDMREKYYGEFAGNA